MGVLVNFQFLLKNSLYIEKLLCKPLKDFCLLFMLLTLLVKM